MNQLFSFPYLTKLKSPFNKNEKSFINLHITLIWHTWSMDITTQKRKKKCTKANSKSSPATYSFIVLSAAARYLASNLQEELRRLAAWSLRICIWPTFMRQSVIRVHSLEVRWAHPVYCLTGCAARVGEFTIITTDDLYCVIFLQYFTAYGTLIC